MFIDSKVSHDLTYFYIGDYVHDPGSGKLLKRLKPLGSLKEITRDFEKDPSDLLRKIVDTVESLEEREQDIPFLEGSPVVNFGTLYAKWALSRIGIQQFLQSRQKKHHVHFSFNEIMRALCFSRLTDPGSIEFDYRHLDLFPERFRASQHDYYRALTYFSDFTFPMEKVIYENTRDLFTQGKTLTLLYDGTNVYAKKDIMPS